MRLARETVNQEDALNAADNIDIEESLADIDDDKTFAAMGIAKTISTVRSSRAFVHPSSDSGIRSSRPLRLLLRFWPKFKKSLFRLSLILWIINFLVRIHHLVCVFFFCWY